MEEHSANVTFSAELDSLRPMLAWILQQIKEGNFSKDELRHIEIALEEALVNIIHYAYQGKGGVIEITYHFLPNDYLEVMIKDYGKPFNPLENGEKIDLFASLEERKEGGLGISFIQKLMDEMSYKRAQSANILRLKKQIK